MASGASPSITVSPITEAQAQAVALWRYDPPYDLYDGTDTEVAVMCDPVNAYHAVQVDGEFVGYVCVGPDALVAGQETLDGIDDLGLGFRPDLTGQGVASSWIPAVLDQFRGQLTAPRQRMVIAAWNTRSQAVARRAGFGEPSRHVNADGEWIVLTRRVVPAGPA